MMHAALLFILLAAAWFDWRGRKIPNALTIPAIAAGLVVQWQGGTGWMALGGVAGAFALAAVPVALKGMGMGDQKLLMAVGAWSSWGEVYQLFLHSILLCLLGVAFYPRTWRRLAANLKLLAVGWSAHGQLWLPAVKQSAMSLPYAVWLLAAYSLRSVWPIAGS